VASNSELPLYPATISMNQRAGRDVTISVRNNAPEIRNFTIEMKADGLDFTPPKIEVTIGASAAREVSFRVFATGAAPGPHAGEAKLRGAASVSEPVRFVVIPPNGAVAFTDGTFSVIESAKRRASFLPGRWFEFIDKDSGMNALSAGGSAFGAGSVEPHADGLVFDGKRTLRLPDLEQLVPKPRK
jgi:hypothetical protein